MADGTPPPAYPPPQEILDMGVFDQSTFAEEGTATNERYREFKEGEISGYQPWQGICYIAAIGDTMVVLFGQPDANGNLVNCCRRMAVKDVQCNPMEWFLPFYWTGVYDENGVRDYSSRIRRNESMETYIHRKVAATSPGSIVGYQGRAHVDTDQWRLRHYMDYCPHGSLKQLIKKYRTLGNFPDVGVTEYLSSERGQTVAIPNLLIPEPFIWYCFRNLAEAAMIMEQGSTEAPVEDWKTIIHRDIKPANVWLQNPPSGRNAQWPLYPRPVLGDFGIAFESGPNDPPANNPRAFRKHGTMGHFAPEQLQWIRKDEDDFRVTDFPPLNSQTNVWEIGSVIYSLVYRCLQVDTPDFNCMDWPNPIPDPCGPVPAPGYSCTLMDLMWECLRLEPTDRPSPSALLKRTFNKQLDFDQVHYQGMRTVKPKLRERWQNSSRSRKHRLHYMGTDHYALGMAWDDIWDTEPEYSRGS